MNTSQNIIIYNTADGQASVSLYTKDGQVWMSQAELAALFDTSVPNISIHISNILKDKELDADSVIKDYLTTATDGKQYMVSFYALEMILAIGFRVRSKRGTQFRVWANRHLKSYMIKGFIIDSDRLKNPEEPKDVVKNWVRNRSTVEFLGLWERINNINFKRVEFDPFSKKQAAIVLHFH